MTIYRTLLALIMLTALAACSSNDSRTELTEKQLYEKAIEQLDDNNYNSAVTTLQQLEARYPFGPYAEQAQLEIIYAHYRAYESEAAISAAERFIRLHPQHPNVDYAYYMKGLANYLDNQGFFTRYTPTDLTERDVGKGIQSFEDFRQLLLRFPDSEYAADARARMIFLRARLARHEINVANYYFKRRAYLAAVKRGQYVVEHYPNTPATADALAVMVQGYTLLGLKNLADSSLAVLRENFPDHPSLDSQGNFINRFIAAGEDRSWLNKLSLGLLDRNPPPRFDNRAEYLRP